MVNDRSPYALRDGEAKRLGPVGKRRWIASLVFVAWLASAAAVPSVTSQTRAAHWLGLAPGARWSWSFEGHGTSGPAGKTRSCEFRTSVEDKVLSVSRQGDLLRVELDRRVGKGAGDRCGGLLPAPESERLVLLVGNEAFLRNGTRNWDPGWSRVESGTGVHTVPANARRPLVDESRLLWVMPLRAGVSWLVDPWESAPAEQPSQLQEVRSVEAAEQGVETAGGSWHGCFRILARLSANTEATEWACEGTGIVRRRERRFAGSLRYDTDLQLTRFTAGRDE